VDGTDGFRKPFEGCQSAVRTSRLILVRLAVGLAVGVSISLLIWWAHVAEKGATIAKALRGEVEDALGVLQALITIGVVVGGSIGLLHGLLAAASRNRDNGTANQINAQPPA
jgi:hypothetical protein